MLLASAATSLDGGLYTWITELAQRSPTALDSTIRLWSDFGLALFALLMLAAWWRSRSDAPARLATALCAPLVVVAAYVANDLLKLAVHEQRPCQTLHAVTVEACPPLGDWSFPSNHAAIAAAAAVAILLTDRRLGAIAVPAALLMAASRVWIGVHYPHDVLIGLVTGALVAWPLTVAEAGAAPRSWCGCARPGCAHWWRRGDQGRGGRAPGRRGPGRSLYPYGARGRTDRVRRSPRPDGGGPHGPARGRAARRSGCARMVPAPSALRPGHSGQGGHGDGYGRVPVRRRGGSRTDRGPEPASPSGVRGRRPGLPVAGAGAALRADGSDQPVPPAGGRLGDACLRVRLPVRARDDVRAHGGTAGGGDRPPGVREPGLPASPPSWSAAGPRPSG